MTLPIQQLTVLDVCALCKVSRSTVERWIRRNELRSVKLGRSRRVKATDLDRFIERQRGA